MVQHRQVNRTLPWQHSSLATVKVSNRVFHYLHSVHALFHPETQVLCKKEFLEGLTQLQIFGSYGTWVMLGGTGPILVSI